MAIERWRPRWWPWRALREMEEEIDRAFEEAFGRRAWPTVWRRWRPVIETRGWAPAVDMFDKEDKLVVRAELPGVKKEDIDVSIVGDTLTIRGERKVEEEVKDEDYYCCERAYGSFYRAISLPTDVETSKVEARYKDGVLEVTLPKAKEAKPEKIEVKVK